VSDRETNDLYFGDPASGTDNPPPDEQGRFAVRIVYLDGVERYDGDDFESLRAALSYSDHARKNLGAAGYDRRRVHVDVVDLDDGERRLDWSTLDS
jgi:hypothetical protein